MSGIVGDNTARASGVIASAGAGGLAVLSTVNITGSAVASIEFDGLFDDATYQCYKLMGRLHHVDTSYLQAQMNVSNTPYTSDAYVNGGATVYTDRNSTGCFPSDVTSQGQTRYPGTTDPTEDRWNWGTTYNYGNPKVHVYSGKYSKLDLTLFPDTTGVGDTFDTTINGFLTYRHYGATGETYSTHGTAMLTTAGGFYNRQRSTGVPTGITFFPHSGNFDTGSQLILYGVKR
jgi:hypothetical protein